MYAILQSLGPLQIVINRKADNSALQAAQRLAHSLNVYHKLDANILDAQEAQDLHHSGSLDGNIVLLGDARNVFLERTLAHRRTPFHLHQGALEFNGRRLERDSSAVFLHPHPTSDAAVMMVMYAADELALERALRLFPIRTGLTVPDWLILTEKADKIGAAGVEAAG